MSEAVSGESQKSKYIWIDTELEQVSRGIFVYRVDFVDTETDTKLRVTNHAAIYSYEEALAEAVKIREQYCD
jgi:hypothetical protein